jgi:hypothetical protein
MARPKKAEPSRRVDVYLPESLYARLTLILFSPVEGRVPHGEWSRFFETLARGAVERAETSTGAPSESA